MKNNILFIMPILCLLLVCISCACSSDGASPKNMEEVGSGEADGYKLVWEDRFNDAKLNSLHWNVEVNGTGGGNAELQYYRSENVAIEKEPVSGRSCLTLTARKESFSNKNATSGRVNSLGKKFFKFGKIEASIKMPRTANGLWPAFWMMGNDHAQVSWPACGEIDIMEMGHSNGIKNGTQNRFFNGACHWGTKPGGNPMYAKDATNGYDMQDDFHLFTLIWTEQSLKMYLDLDKYPTVKPYFEMNISDKSSETSPGNYFQKDNFILFNLAVGGNFTGIWDINKITALGGGEAKMYIDYVKVYQK